MDTSTFIIVVVIGVLIFLAIRDLLLWYWKINKQIEIQEKILGAMLIIIEELRMNSKAQESKPKENKPIQERIKD